MSSSSNDNNGDKNNEERSKQTRPRSRSSAEDEQPKKKRRQVKKACLNCRIAHSACDEGRPCKRCINHGLQASCVDVARRNAKNNANPLVNSQLLLAAQLSQQQQQQQPSLLPQQQPQQPQGIIPPLSALNQSVPSQPVNGLGQIGQLAQLGLQQGPLLQQQNNPNAHMFLAQQYIPFLNSLAAQHQTLINVVQQLQSANQQMVQQQQRLQHQQVNQQLHQQHQQHQQNNPFQIPNQTSDEYSYPNYLPPYNPNPQAMANQPLPSVVPSISQTNNFPTTGHNQNIVTNSNNNTNNNSFDTMFDQIMADQGRNKSRSQMVSPTSSSTSSPHRSRSVTVPSSASSISAPSPDPIPPFNDSASSTSRTDDGNDSDEEEVVRFAPNVELSDFQFNLIDDYFTKIFDEENKNNEQSTSGTNDNNAVPQSSTSQSSRMELSETPEFLYFPNRTGNTQSAMCIAVWRMDGTLYSATETFLKWFHISPSQQLVKNCNLHDVNQLNDGMVNQETPYSDLLHYSQIFHPSNDTASFQQEMKRVLSGKSSFFSGAAKLSPVSSRSKEKLRSSELDLSDLANDRLIDCHVSCYCVENATQQFYAVSHVLIEYEES